MVSNPIDVTGAQPRYATGEEQNRREDEPKPLFDPYTGKPLFKTEEPQPVAAFERPIPDAGPPVNPYAPTGWKRQSRVEFDITTPSGQLCRVMRLEREDLFRLNLMQYLDTFTPMLLDDMNAISEAERDRQIREAIKEKPDALANMFIAIDEIVMAATVRPKVTNDESLVNYGNPSDWSNPNFVAVAHINDLKMDDRMVIFGAAFGRSMDDLKSVWEQAPGMAGVANVPGVQHVAE